MENENIREFAFVNCQIPMNCGAGLIFFEDVQNHLNIEGFVNVSDWFQVTKNRGDSVPLFFRKGAQIVLDTDTGRSQPNKIIIDHDCVLYAVFFNNGIQLNEILNQVVRRFTNSPISEWRDKQREIADDEKEEIIWCRGNKAAYTAMLRTCLAELGWQGNEAEQVKWILEREAVIATLRGVCDRLGDNDWPDDLHLSDIINKHLINHVEDC